MKTLGERIAYIQSRVGAKKLQDAADIPQSTLSRYIRNQSVPPVDRVVAMAKAGGVNVGWLAAGEDEAPELSTNTGFSRLPMIPDSASPPMLFDIRCLNQMSDQPQQLRGFVSHSDAMEPSIRQGSLLVVCTDIEIGSDGIFLIRLAGELMVKRLQRTPEGKRVLISDNDRYPNHTLEEEQFASLEIVGHVCWSGGPC